MNQWGMVVDLNRCVGCQTCTIACKHANATPPDVQWRKVIDVEYGSFPNVQRLFVVTGCQHCENPPCVPVCPTGATARRADGLVTIDYDLCIGCGSCAVACPYQARTIVHEKELYYGDRATAQELQTPHEERLGVANKCTFCIERIDAAAEENLIPGVDPEATPACVAACIAQALKFGDFADPDSEVSRLARDHKSFQMHGELGTEPRVRYLYEVPGSMPGRDLAPEDADDEARADPSNPLVGKRQPFWDYRAAMNFALGGMASGLAVVSWLAFLAGWVGAQALGVLNLFAAAIMAVGLLFVFLKLGRKLRFLYVLRRPQTSWMSRETYCVALFFPAVAASLFWPHPLLHLIIGLAAVGFLISQALILYSSKGIPSWRAPLVPWMLVSTGLFEGAGLLAVVSAFMGDAGAPVSLLAGLGVALALVNALLWTRYRRSGRANRIGPLAMRDIDAVMPVVVLGGHALPALLFAVSLFLPVAAVLAGLAAVTGGFYWKFVLVTRACHQQGFALPKLPQRGSGINAAPFRPGIGAEVRA